MNTLHPTVAGLAEPTERDVLACPSLSLRQRFFMTDAQTLDLIHSIISAVQAGIAGDFALRDQLLRDTEKRFAYPRFLH